MIRLLGMMIQILRRKPSIVIERWWIFEPRYKSLIKIIRTLAWKGNQSQNYYGYNYYRYRDMSRDHDKTKSRKRTTRTRVAFMFRKRIKMLDNGFD